MSYDNFLRIKTKLEADLNAAKDYPNRFADAMLNQGGIEELVKDVESEGAIDLGEVRSLGLKAIAAGDWEQVMRALFNQSGGDYRHGNTYTFDSVTGVKTTSLYEAYKYDGHLTSEQDRNTILNKLDEELRKL